MNKDLLEKIKILNKELQPEKLEKLIENELEKHPRDIELWFKLAIVELIPPLADYYKSLDCLNKVLEYDKNNPHALLLQAYVYDTRLGGVDEKLFNKLCEINVEDKELQSLIELAKAWHFRFSYYFDKKHGDLYEKFMLKSVELRGYVYSYKELAMYYHHENQERLAIQFLRKALADIKIIYTQTFHKEDYTNMQEFIDENIKGIHITDINRDRIEKLLRNSARQ